MSNELVAYSRAGDVFHYRWAARRCLGLVYPNALLKSVVIEGSKEYKKKGEYVIDVSEYYEQIDNKQIKYYQLKHTTVQKDIPFVLSDLKGTIEGFSERFSQHLKEANDSELSFIIVTNRPVNKTFKNNIQLIANKQQVNGRFRKTIEKYTQLSSNKLSLFCSLLHFEDSEGDYNIQKNELKIEISQLIAGAVDNAQVESIVALVNEKVLPDSDGVIYREEILKRFKITSEKDLFPAPAIWEQNENIIEREQHQNLKQNIFDSSYPVIIHASGGVGKSVFCRQLIDSLPSGSVGIAYDCFGAGRYRNRSESRHRHRDALVQIVNELAVKGLCDPLLVQDTSLDSDIMKKFLLRIECSVKALKKVKDSVLLVILIDAADNAEMAAQEFSHPCFANELLREDLPEGCKLGLLCRTERIHLLKPNSKISKFELKAFSENETLLNLRKWFPDADEKDGTEFHRLTNGNPRVQANALDIKASSISELLSQLGPAGMTVEGQIELQLNTAISKLKDSLSGIFQEQMDSICLGLASLPPHIPINILAKASGVKVEEVKSFVADIGRSLWLSDESVQFRDEPTETWFRKTYLATKEDFESYIRVLEPIANHSSYIAEVLPHLYLQAEQYSKLIEIALSDNYLPEDNPIDARNVRVYRLQFAFRAALRAKQYDDAIKIAMRSGEEVAGNQRQFHLFQNNIDLLILLQDKQKVQDIAFKRLLSGSWNGSENVYIASLLSGINDYKGEARGYLRAAINWLQIFYKERHEKEERYSQINVENGDILELTYAFFNIYGVDDCIKFLNRFTSKGFIFRIVKALTRRLIDIGNFKAIETFLQKCTRQPYFTVAIVSELVKIGKYPQKILIETCLQLLTKSKYRIKKIGYYIHDDIITPAIVSFVEACLYRSLPQHHMLRVLRHYMPERATQIVYSNYQYHERTVYLKSLAIQTLLKNRTDVNIDEILPKNLLTEKSKKTNQQNDDIKEFTELINVLFPWYFFKAKLLNNQEINFDDAIKEAISKSNNARSNRYRQNDTLPYELASLQSSILFLINTNDIDNFYNSFIKENKSVWIPDEINTVRAAFRLPHLSHLKQQLEQKAYNRIKSITDDGPEAIAERYISLARAVLNTAPDDASIYFEEAIKIVSKFGDEIVRRWEAVVSIAKQVSLGGNISDKLAYRFIRCAEVVGESVAREKYWDRSEAIAICARMSSGAGISALSRWRDRDIGSFEYQLEALLIELIKYNKISPAVCWSFSRFFSYHQHTYLLSLCLHKESNVELKKEIFADAVYLLQIESTSVENWKEMQQIAFKQDIKNDTLDNILAYYQINESVSLETNEIKTSSKSKSTDDKINWETVFGKLNILKIEDFEECLNQFNSISKSHHYRKFEDFCEEALLRLHEKDYWKFIEVLLLSDLSRYEIKLFFNSLPEEWLNKVSVRKKWPDLIRQLGSKFSHDLVTLYGFKYFTQDFNLTGQEIDKLKEGIFDGLSNGYEFSNAEMFFGFPSIVVPMISSDEKSSELLDFALSRFELHIDSDFGDGEWSDWLSTNKDINKNIAGFIWSALGSPRSSERWNAAHSVRMLAKFSCIEIIDELIIWMQYDKVDAFGNIKFPFYNLHAKQYLLLALSRISLDNPKLLIKYKDIFVQYALKETHILIQKSSADIAINIANSNEGVFDQKILEKLKGIGKSKMPFSEINYNEKKDSYWHTKKEIDTKYEFHFGWDFDRYWFEPLGDVFGIPGKQVEDIAAHVIIKEWGIKDESGYNNDPRVSIWNRYSHERETWHDHGSYPRTDNLDFYLSYHSMMAAASKLLEKMPVVSNEDWYDDEDAWIEWLRRHLLTCNNGKWLADYRDPVPLKRPKWIFSNKNGDWRTNISEQDYLDALLIDKDGEQWLNIRGGWEETDNEHIESISITSALVSKHTSNALMRALDTCSDPYDYKLPDYNESNMEIDSGSFMLKGWIIDGSVSKRLDEYDPYADNLGYPPYTLGNDIVKELGVLVNNNGTVSFPKEENSSLMSSKIWSSYRDISDEKPSQAGNRLQASLRFLKHVCSTFNCDIIFEIEIEREISYKYRNREEEYEYSRPKQKLFLLSDGQLKTTEANHKLG